MDKVCWTMPRDWFDDVLQFHRKFGCHIEPWPRNAPERLFALRYNLIREEWSELGSAMSVGDLAGIGDGIADLIYVLLGTAITYGIDLRPVWDAVHKTNMLKVGGGERKDGKILKPEGWQAPDVKDILERQEPLQ